MKELSLPLLVIYGKIREIVNLTGFALHWGVLMGLFLALLSLLLAGCIPTLFFGVGLLVTFAGLWALRKEFHISKYGLLVLGEVVAIDARRKRTRGRATVYDALVRFQMLEGADPVTFTVTTGSFRVYQIH